jgi:hypothetical protein
MMQKRQQQQTRTSTRPTKPEIPIPVVVQEVPVYKPFPHPHTPVTQDLLRWAHEGAYLITYNSNAKPDFQYRYLHKECEGTYGNTSKTEMKAFSKRKPVIVMDLSRYPTLAEEDEWETVIKTTYPEYKSCFCPWFRYMLHGEGIQRKYYQLREPYFYLCGMNREGTDCLKHVRLVSELHSK